MVTIVDTEGRFLGALNDGDHFVLTMPPGRHGFVGFFRESADLISGDLAAGRVYYVLVAMVPGEWHARVNMQALGPQASEWQGRSELVTETLQLVSLVEEGQAALDPMEARRKIRNAERRWAGYSADERSTHSLSPDEGERIPELPSIQVSSTVAADSPAQQLSAP